MEYRHQMHHYRLRKVYLFTSPTHHLHLEEDAINVTSTLSQPYSVNNEKKTCNWSMTTLCWALNKLTGNEIKSHKE